MRTIEFIEMVIQLTTKPDDVEFFTQLLFELKKDGEWNE
jgi:hypothetical protein